MDRLTNFLSHAGISQHGATVAYLLKFADACGIEANRMDVLAAAHSLDWKVVSDGAVEVVIPPYTSGPLKLHTFDAD